MIDEGRRLGKQCKKVLRCVLRSSRAARFERGKERTKSVRGAGDLQRGTPPHTRPHPCALNPKPRPNFYQHFVCGPNFGHM
jgi:hypothetical protein